METAKSHPGEQMKVGILTNAYEVSRIQALVDYLRHTRGATVNLYVEEEEVVHYPNCDFDEDVFFTKGKGYLLLSLARLAEAYGAPRGVKVVNDAQSTWRTMHRFIYATLCRRAGVPVPDFVFEAHTTSHFDTFIAKNVIDQHHLRFLDRLPVVGTAGKTVPPIPTAEEAGPDDRAEEYHFFQRFLESEYEYKVYGFGDRLLFYRQTPVLVNPNKMATRVPISENEELREMAERTMEVIGLNIVSLDFLKEDGRYYLTDVNPIPNFNYVPDGPAILGDYLLSLAAEAQ